MSKNVTVAKEQKVEVKKQRYKSWEEESAFMKSFIKDAILENETDLENVGRETYAMMKEGKEDNKAIRYPIKTYRNKLNGKEPFEPQEIIPLLYVTGKLNKKLTLENYIDLYLEQKYERDTQMRRNAEKRITELLEQFYVPNISNAQKLRISELERELEKELDGECKKELARKLELENDAIVALENNFPVHKYFSAEKTLCISSLQEAMAEYFYSHPNYRAKFDKKNGFTAVETLLILYLTGSLSKDVEEKLLDALYELADKHGEEEEAIQI